MFILRDAARELLRAVDRFSVVTLTGPRHAGKTSLARRVFSRFGYVNFETPESRETALADPEKFLARHPNGLIIDEYMRVPELASFWRGAESRRVRGRARLLLVTSRSPVAAQGFSFTRPPQPIPADMRIMMPLSIGEMTRAGINMSRDEYIYRGFMPRTYAEEIEPGRVYLNYISYFIDYEARRLIDAASGADDMAGVDFTTGTMDRKAEAAARARNPTANPADIDQDFRRRFWRLMRLLAQRAGQVINPASLAQLAGITRPTLLAWLAALEAGYIIFRLPPYFKSYNRRITAISKFYFTDVGMAAYLLGIKSPEQAFRDPAVGHLFENMVVAEAFKCRYNAGLAADLYYFREQNEYNSGKSILEVDMVFQKRKCVMPVEIKYSSETNPLFAANVEAFRTLSSRIGEGCVIYGGATSRVEGRTAFMNFKEMSRIMTDW